MSSKDDYLKSMALVSKVSESKVTNAFDLSGMSVMLAMPISRDLPIETVASLIDTMDMLRARNFGNVEIRFQKGGTIPESRSKSVHQFIEWAPDEKAKLFFLDSDMVWTGEDVIRTLALSTVYDLVFGAYPAKRDPPLFYVHYDTETVELNAHGLMRVKGLGLGFGSASLRAMRAVWNKGKWLQFPGGDKFPVIFRYDDDGQGTFRGEDMAFFHDLDAAGFPLYVDPMITLGHVGTKIYRANILDSMQRITSEAAE